ncbi:50S ribosomal protein L6 [Candidatus Woesearchaeota archaeon]|nr:50S ribosomal protein L6 [Candidatus Woesearchaeota archaeon]
MAKEKKSIDVELDVPQGIEVKIDGSTVSIKGPKGEVKKVFVTPYIKLECKENKILIKAGRSTKREEKLIGTLKANIKNMFKGASELHKYQLKVCSGHFPMKVAAQGNTFTINNFLGEKFPRTLKLREGVGVKVEGDMINVESADKNLAGQTAADIEQLTRRTNYDTRIFQDGIYTINKDGKEIK